MHGHALNYREAVKLLNNNGFYLNRISGDHAIFKNVFGKVVCIPRCQALSQKTLKRELKKVGIDYE